MTLTLNLGLTLASAAVQAALVVVFCFRKLHLRLKFFFGYLLCSTIGVVLRLSFLSRAEQYYLLYWILEAVYSALTFAAVTEIFWPALGVVYRRFGTVPFLIPLGILVLTDYVFWRPIHRGVGSTMIGRLVANISAFELGVSFIAVLIFLFALWLEKRMGIWGQYALGVVGGFALIGFGTLTAYCVQIWLLFGSRSKIIFQYAPSSAFFAAVLIWFVIFLEKEKPEAPQKPLDHEKFIQVLDSVTESFNDLRRKARRLRIRFWWRLSSQRPGLTS